MKWNIQTRVYTSFILIKYKPSFLSLSPAYPPYFLALRANPGNKAKKGNPDCNGEMEKQLRNQRLNSEFSSQSIPRKPRTISNVDNSLAVPYLSPQSGVKRLLGW